MTNYDHLFELNDLAQKDAKNFPKKRELFYQLQGEKGKHFTGIIGPRGVGKTVILKQFSSVSKDRFYISVDTLDDQDLFDIVRDLTERYRYRKILIDEIHYQKDYTKQLKKIYDFLDVKIIFSSSVSLSLHEASSDLSRRVRLTSLNPFSFREYLYFQKNILLPVLTIEDILKEAWQPEHLRYEYLFEDYLKGGLMPFALDEPAVLPLLKNILTKIIQKDIPAFVRLSTDDLPLLKKTVRFIGRSEVDGINYSSLAKNIGITKYKAETYLHLLEKAFVLHVIFPSGTNILKEPKVLMQLPFRLLFKNYKDALGGLREDFAVGMIRLIENEIFYLKSTRGAKTPDYLIKLTGVEPGSASMVVEIGGKGKGREQFKGIKVEKKIILCHPGIVKGIKRPLFLLGFL